METIRFVGRFFVHILCGTILFGFVGAPAIGLEFLVRYLTVEWHLPYAMLVVVSALEYLLFFVDALLYALFVIVEGLRLGKQILDQR